MSLVRQIAVTAECDRCGYVFPAEDGESAWRFGSWGEAVALLTADPGYGLPAWAIDPADGSATCSDCRLVDSINACAADGGHDWQRVTFAGQLTVHVDCACGAVETRPVLPAERRRRPALAVVAS